MSDEEKTKKDLTKISDLTDFFHDDDPELDLKFDIHESHESGEEENEYQEGDEETDEKDQPPEPPFEENSEQEEDLDEASEDLDLSLDDSFYDFNNESSEFSDFETSDDPPPIESFEQNSEELQEDNFPSQEPPSLNNDDDLEGFDDSEEKNIEEKESESESIHVNFAPFEEDHKSSSIEEPIKEILPSAPVKSISEIKKGIDSLRFQSTQTQANPAFSILIENIQYQEDADELFKIIQDLGLISSDTETLMKQSLSHGRALISHISEFTGITLLNKIKNLELDFKMGLSHQIHESKNYETQEKGLISKENLKQNKSSYQNLQHIPKNAQDVLTSTTPTLENFLITKYIRVVTSSRNINREELFFSSEEDISDNKIYNSLLLELKEKAFKCQANAIIGILFQTIPNQNQTEYQILCTGNAVCVMKES